MDLVQKEQAEVSILKRYQPEQLTPEELTKLIEEQIIITESKTIKDMGKLMKALTVIIKGRADNKVVSEIIRGRLV